MKAFFDPRQLRHAPEIYFRRGAAMPHQEQPRRAELLRDMLIGEGFDITGPRDYGAGPIKAVHNPDYVDFLTDAHARFVADAGPDATLTLAATGLLCYAGHVCNYYVKVFDWFRGLPAVLGASGA